MTCTFAVRHLLIAYLTLQTCVKVIKSFSSIPCDFHTAIITCNLLERVGYDGTILQCLAHHFGFHSHTVKDAAIFQRPKIEVVVSVHPSKRGECPDITPNTITP